MSEWDDKFDIDERMESENYNFYEITNTDKERKIESDEKLAEISNKNQFITIQLKFEKEKDDFEQQKKCIQIWFFYVCVFF